MAYPRKIDHWGKLQCLPYGNSADARTVAAEHKLDDGLQVHRIFDKDDNSDAGAVRIAFVYESDEEDCAKIVARCAQRTLLNHKVNKLEYIYAIKVPEHESYFAIVCDYLYAIEPDVVIVVSRDIMRKLNPPKAYDGVDMLQLINRLHTIRWDDVDYPTVVTMPDNEVLMCTEDGKVAKEAASRLGEWVGALTVALRKCNLYTIDVANYTYETITTLDRFEVFMDALYAAKLVSIDTETDNLNRIVNKLGTIQFAFDGDKAWVLPMHHPESPFSPKQMEYICGELREYFEHVKDTLHIYVNAKFDLIQLFRDLKLRWYAADTWDCQGGEYCLQENRKFRTVKLVNWTTGKDVLSAYSLAQLTLEYGCTAYLSGNMGKEDRGNIFGTPLKDVSQYGGKDTVIPFQMYHLQMQEFQSRGPAYRRCATIVRKQFSSMIRSFVEMESTGMLVDKAYLIKEVASEGAFVKARKQARDEIYAMESVIAANALLVQRDVGPDLFGRNAVDNWVFDIDKTEHQCLLFFEVLKLEPVKIGKSGNPSVDKAFKDKYAPLDDSGKLLEDIAVPEVAMFRDYSELKHLYNTFLKGFLEKFYDNIDMRKDGKLRPSFKFLQIVTGRTGAEKPSLQQVPSRSKLAKAIKRQFIAAEGQLIIACDASAAEVRNWGIASNEPNMIRSFGNILQKRKEFRLLDTVADPKAWEDTFKALDPHRQNCLTGDALVDSDRGLLRMDDPRLEGAMVMGRLGPAKVAKHICNGERPVYELKTKGGRCIKVTAYHQFPVFDRNKGEFTWKPLRAIKAEDYVMWRHDVIEHTSTLKLMLKHYPNRVKGGITKHIKLPRKMTPELAYFIGLVLSEGSIRKSYSYLDGNDSKSPWTGVEFTNSDPILLDVFEQGLRLFGLEHKRVLKAKKGKECRIVGVGTKHTKDAFKICAGSTDLVYMLDQLGVQKETQKEGLPCHSISLPWAILEADDKCKIAFLSAYMDGDGCATRKTYPCWSTTSKAMVQGLALLAQSVGIETRVIYGSGKGRYGIVHTVNIVGDIADTARILNACMLSKQIPGEDYRKGRWLLPADYWRKGMRPIKRGAKNIPIWKAKDGTEFTDAKSTANNYLEKVDHLNFYDTYAHIERVKKVLRRINPIYTKKWKAIQDNNWNGDQVASIEYIGKEKVYDLSIAEGYDPSFTANGLVVHNCKLFYGVEPLDVPKSMRSKVKTLVFGTVYGMSAMRLAITLKITEEEAQELIDLLFEKFPDGTLYITETHATGAKYLTVVSGIGRVRHLWGYLHTNYGVYGAMDRRGVNSKIQSIASDEVCEGNYQTQRLRWHYFWSQDLPLRFRIGNAVHDSSVAYSNIATIPIVTYLMEHGYTTAVYQSYLENYGMEFPVGLEMDFEIGANYGDMEGWNYRPETLRSTVEKAVKWQQDNLGYKVGKDAMAKFEHNLELIDDLRCQELRKLPANGVNTYMALTRKLAKECRF